ncbi:hypothetical protein Tco_1312010 [Tanacetum coccineum]
MRKGDYGKTIRLKKRWKRMIAKAILQERGNIQPEISSQIQKAIDNHIPSQVDASYCSPLTSFPAIGIFKDEEIEERTSDGLISHDRTSLHHKDSVARMSLKRNCIMSITKPDYNKSQENDLREKYFTDYEWQVLGKLRFE